MLWAEEDPQQFQSLSSMRSILTDSQNLNRDRVFSCPEVFKEHPGKNENFSLPGSGPVLFVLEDFINGFFILNPGGN